VLQFWSYCFNISNQWHPVEINWQPTVNKTGNELANKQSKTSPKHPNEGAKNWKSTGTEVTTNWQ